MSVIRTISWEVVLAITVFLVSPALDIGCLFPERTLLIFQAPLAQTPVRCEKVWHVVSWQIYLGPSHRLFSLVVVLCRSDQQGDMAKKRKYPMHSHSFAWPHEICQKSKIQNNHNKTVSYLTETLMRLSQFIWWFACIISWFNWYIRIANESRDR
jgi:hypothetical protein